MYCFPLKGEIPYVLNKYLSDYPDRVLTKEQAEKIIDWQFKYTRNYIKKPFYAIHRNKYLASWSVSLLRVQEICNTLLFYMRKCKSNDMPEHFSKVREMFVYYRKVRHNIWKVDHALRIKNHEKERNRLQNSPRKDSVVWQHSQIVKKRIKKISKFTKKSTEAYSKKIDALYLEFKKLNNHG